MEWIRCSERLPDSENDCLFKIKDDYSFLSGKILSGFFDKTVQEFKDHVDYMGFEISDIEKWIYTSNIL